MPLSESAATRNCTPHFIKKPLRKTWYNVPNSEILMHLLIVQPHWSFSNNSHYSSGRNPNQKVCFISLPPMNHVLWNESSVQLTTVPPCICILVHVVSYAPTVETSPHTIFVTLISTEGQNKWWRDGDRKTRMGGMWVRRQWGGCGRIVSVISVMS